MDTPDGPSSEVVDITMLTRRAAADATTPVAPVSAGTAIVPRIETVVRAGTPADVPFLDRLQKAHSRELGFLPTMALEGKIKLGQVLVAEAGGRAVGYLIAADRYFKRDEIGYVTQINVLPEVRRSLVAATLLQAQFDRSAYGCRLYCCWCAQDLKANEFWEAMGFTAIAFRTGSRTKGKTAGGKTAPRIHLFWQKRVRAGDTADVSRGGTPWWYPAQTSGGEMREDRLVFPIPPGVHWRDVLPVVLPGRGDVGESNPTAAADAGETDGDARSALMNGEGTSPAKTMRPRTAPTAAAKPGETLKGGLWFGGAGRPGGRSEEERLARADAKAAAKAAEKAAGSEIDPRLTAMARELRDRWSERAAFLLSFPGKYDLRRTLDPTSRAGVTAPPPRLALAAA